MIRQLFVTQEYNSYAGNQARADFLIMLSGVERGENARILRHADLHIREYRNIGPEPLTADTPGARAVCWVQDEAKGNQARLAQELSSGAACISHPCVSHLSKNARARWIGQLGGAIFVRARVCRQTTLRPVRLASQEGVEELNGGLPHKDPLLCVQLAVAVALFSQFHMRNYPPPDFSSTSWYNRPFACSTSHENAVSWEVRTPRTPPLVALAMPEHLPSAHSVLVCTTTALRHSAIILAHSAMIH